MKRSEHEEIMERERKIFRIRICRYKVKLKKYRYKLTKYRYRYDNYYKLQNKIEDLNRIISNLEKLIEEIHIYYGSNRIDEYVTYIRRLQKDYVDLLHRLEEGNNNKYDRLWIYDKLKNNINNFHIHPEDEKTSPIMIVEEGS